MSTTLWSPSVGHRIYDHGVTSARRQLLITDLDNTLWDWVDAWYAAYSVLIHDLSEASGVPRNVLESEIRSIHQRWGTSEYSNLVNEIPSIVTAAAPISPHIRYRAVLHAFRSKRMEKTKLYPGVLKSLTELKSGGVKIVAYTESQAYWSAWRIGRTGLDGIIDVLYSAEDHDLPAGMTKEDLRSGHYSNESYGLKVTKHHWTPRGASKPNSEILHSILHNQNISAEDAVYIGDSLMKDVAMAQSVGVLDVHAKYGEAHSRAGYDLLRRVTHWSDEDVERERNLAESNSSVIATLVCRQGFSEIVTADLPRLGKFRSRRAE